MLLGELNRELLVELDHATDPEPIRGRVRNVDGVSPMSLKAGDWALSGIRARE